MRFVAFLLLCMALMGVSSVEAQTSNVRWQLSDLNGVPIPGAAPTTTQSACDTLARSLNVTRSYTCPRILNVTGTTPPPPTCTTPQPAAETQPVACPAGSTGSWTQTRTYSAAPYPTCWAAGAWTPTTAPAGACTTTTPPPVGSGPVLYFAASGVNSNPGTQAAPKRDLSGINLNALAAGATLLFNRGDTFNTGYMGLENMNATEAAPIVFDAYGSGARPVWMAQNGTGVEVGRHRTGAQPGPFVFRNIVLDGGGTRQWGFFNRGHKGLTLENLEIRGFQIGIHSQNLQRTVINDKLTLRNVTITRNSEMGMLGDADNMIIENSVFSENNFSGSNFNHGIYLGGYGRNGVIRNTQFIRNSVANGVCTGGNLTVHGQWDGLVIEGNTVTQDASVGSCYGIVVTGGYTSQEWFRNVVLRGNTVLNVGGCAICINTTENILIEANKLINMNPTWMSGIVRTGSGGDANHADDVGGVIRDNTVCLAAPAAGSVAVNVPPSFTVSGTVLQTGAAASTGACAR